MKKNRATKDKLHLSLLNLYLLRLLLIHIHRRSPRFRRSLCSRRGLVGRASATSLHAERVSKRLLRRSWSKAWQSSSRVGLRVSIVSEVVIVRAVDASSIRLSRALNAQWSFLGLESISLDPAVDNRVTLEERESTSRYEVPQIWNYVPSAAAHRSYPQYRPLGM
jgi:hypothetical protein